MIHNINRKENYLSFDGKTDVYLNFDRYVYDFGYYDIVTGEGLTGAGTLVSGDRKSGYLGTFDENDKIGIWVRPRGMNPYRYTSTDISQWNPKTKFVGTAYEVELDDDDGLEDLEIEFTVGSRMEWDDGGWEVGGLEFEILAPYQGQGGSAVPSGQPLPGGLPALVLVLAVSGAWFFYSKKKDRKAAA